MFSIVSKTIIKEKDIVNIIFDLLSQLLQKLYFVIGDWGLTIVTITLLIRVCLLPFSLKQKANMGKQQLLSKKMEEIKEKYRNNKEKLDQELGKLTAESAKNMLGCFVTLVQLPIMYSLYSVFIKMPFEVGTMIVPWVVNIKLPDIYFIIPILSTLVQLMPNLLIATGALKNLNIPKATNGQMAITIIINLLFLAKAPVTIGIYFITSGLFSFLEQVIYSAYMRKRSVTS